GLHTSSKRDWSSDVCSSDLALLKVGLVDVLPALADSPEGSLVDHVGQLRAGGAGGGPGDGVQVHVISQLHLLGVDLQDVLTALRSEERRVGKGCPERSCLVH